MDIDLDFPSTFRPEVLFKTAVRASMVKGDQLVKHPAGMYFQNISKDAITNLAAIPYDKAENKGYLKIDFLHLSLLNYFESKQEMRLLLKKEPNWELLKDSKVVGKLFQIHNHFDIVKRIKPRSIIQLSDTIALIRPNKRKLLTGYLKDPKLIRDNLLYKREPGDDTSFKKGHALVYSLNIVLQMHLINAGIL